MLKNALIGLQFLAPLIIWSGPDPEASLLGPVNSILDKSVPRMDFQKLSKMGSFVLPEVSLQQIFSSLLTVDVCTFVPEASTRVVCRLAFT